MQSEKCKSVEALRFVLFLDSAIWDGDAAGVMVVNRRISN